MTQAVATVPTHRTARTDALVTFLVISAVITALRWPFAWTSNEETYFILAHRLVEPAAYGPMDAVFDSSRGKWVGLLSFGGPIKLFGFEAAHVLLGGITVMVTAAGLAALARMIRLPPLASVAMLLLFMALGQSIVGSEWFVGAIETKTISYGLGLIALAMANDRRPRIAALLVVVAAYFHFLVGGFWLFAVALFLTADPAMRPSLRSFLPIALLLLLPLLVVLFVDARDASATPQPAGTPSADFIYSVLRASHHVAPFDGPRPWALRALATGTLGLVLAPLCWSRARRAEGALQPLLRTLAIAVLLLPFAVALSWIDRHHGALGKFYLFRPVSPLLLLMLFAGAAIAQLQFGGRRRASFAWIAVIAGSLAYMAVLPLHRWPARDPDVGPLIASVQAHTAPDQIVLVDPGLDSAAPTLDGASGSSLARKLERPMYVSWKFVPTNAPDIYRWYGRLEQRKRLFDEACPSDPRVGALILTIDHLLSHVDCGALVYRDRQAAVLVLGSPASGHSGTSKASVPN